jgi:hypothetical protein
VKHLLRKPQDKHKYHSFSTKWQLSPVGFSLSFFDTFFILPEKLEKKTLPSGNKFAIMKKQFITVAGSSGRTKLGADSAPFPEN